MGTGKGSHVVSVIDFGLNKKFRDSKTSTYIPYIQDDFHGIGTSLFAAIWDLIRDAKIANEEFLTLGLPPEFDVLYRYARGLEFDDLPDYEGLRNLFRGLAERMGYRL
jgi:casein kinase I family protein HRR25